MFLIHIDENVIDDVSSLCFPFFLFCSISNLEFSIFHFFEKSKSLGEIPVTNNKRESSRSIHHPKSYIYETDIR